MTHSGVAEPVKARSDAVRRRYGLIAVVSALGVALMCLAVPRTVAAWASMKGSDVFDALFDRPVDGADLAAGVDGLEYAASWVPSAARYAMIGSLEAEQVRRLARNDPKRRELLASAERFLSMAIVGNPTDELSCMKLAQLREQRGASAREIISPVVHSLDLAPNIRQGWLWRASYLLTYWGALTPDEVLIARSQLRTIWREDPKMRRPLVETAIGLRQQRMLTRALSEEPGATDELSKIEGEISGARKP